MTPAERKVYEAHEKHAWTLAFMVFGLLGVVVYILDEWLTSPKRGSWAELAHMALYVAAFFAVFGLSFIKDWFLRRLSKD